MVWFIVGSGVLMTAAGIAYLILGFDIVMTERGSAMTIGGTIALCSGLATIALGLATRRLTQILRVLEGIGRAAPAPEAAPGAAAVTPPEPTQPPRTETVSRVPADPAAVYPDGALGGAEQPVIQRTAALGAAVGAAGAGALVLMEAPPAGTNASETSAPEASPDHHDADHDDTVRNEEAGAAAAKDPLDDIVEALLDDPADVGETEPTTAPIFDDARAEDHSAVDPSEVDSSAAVLSAVESSADDGPAPEDRPQAVTEDIPPAAEPQSLPPDERDAAGPPESKDRGEPPPEPSPARGEPAVLGTYRAGGRTYTMYSDGTVEAAAADGVERFESMQALREHLART